MPKHNNCSLHTILLGFTLTYFTKESLRDNITKNFTSDILSYNASGLTPITAYTFQISARTSVGVGPVIAATIQSGIPPVLPGQASRLAVSNIDAQSVVLQFTPGFDGNTSITKWTVEASTKKRNESSWFIVDETSDPDAKNVVVHNLIPFTEYRLRLLSTNVVGTRPPSEPTKYFQTIQAPPSHAPYNVTVRAVNNLTLHKAPGARPEKVTVTPYTTTSVKVEWQPIPPMTWNGDFNPAAYKIEYCMISAYAVPQSTDCPSKRVFGINSTSVSLENLEQDKMYEIKVISYNGQGNGPASLAVSVYVGEAVPTGSPKDVKTEALSSTEVKVVWKPPLENQRNGDLLGYKIFYQSEIKGVPEKLEVVPESSSSYVLMDLSKYRDYKFWPLIQLEMGHGHNHSSLKH